MYLGRAMVEIEGIRGHANIHVLLEKNINPIMLMNSIEINKHKHVS